MRLHYLCKPHFFCLKSLAYKLHNEKNKDEITIISQGGEPKQRSEQGKRQHELIDGF
jgi:hypothetical protein